MRLFFDTNALFKLYHVEAGSEALISFVESLADEPRIVISAIAIVEFTSALYRRIRQHEIERGTANEILMHFEKQRAQLAVVTVDASVLSKADLLIRQHGEYRSLRTLDAIQVASALVVEERARLKFDKFVTSDNVVIQIASEYFSILNPLNL